MSLRLGVRAVLLALALGAALPASASALTLQADRPETGWIRLTVPDAGDATHVTLAEQVGQAQKSLADQAPAAGKVVLEHAAAWRCDIYGRQFVATAAYPDGSTQTATASIQTPSCNKRLVLSASRTRGRIRVRAVDRWKVGDVAVRTCVRPPGAAEHCATLTIASGGSTTSHSYLTRSSGLWGVALTTAWGQRDERMVYVRPRRRLRLLATGDSMIQIVDNYLKDRLGPRGIGVRSDARISTGLSKPFLLNWPKHAAGQARQVRPDVTVVFIGANDGFPFGGIDCCGQAWVDAYAKRAEEMMRAYSRGGRGLVYWLTLPAPRPAQWKPVYPAVNRAVERAAATFHGAVRVVDIARTITPGYRFRQSMTWHGHSESVRQPDGVHLSPAGASIAEALIERALRADGVL